MVELSTVKESYLTLLICVRVSITGAIGGCKERERERAEGGVS